MEHIGEKNFKEPVAAFDGLCNLFSLIGEACTLVRFVIDKVFFRKALEGLGHARGRDLEALCNRSRLCRAICPGDIINRFEIFLNLFLCHPINY